MPGTVSLFLLFKCVFYGDCKKAEGRKVDLIVEERDLNVRQEFCCAILGEGEASELRLLPDAQLCKSRRAGSAGTGSLR